MKAYLIARLKEISSHMGMVITMLPMFFDLSNTEIAVLMVIGVLFFGVPEDKVLRMAKK